MLAAALALAASARAGVRAGVRAGTMSAPYPYWPKEFAFVYEGGWFHLFYIRINFLAPHPDSTQNDFGHAISQNLTDWFHLDPVLPVRAGEWDDVHVWAPSIIRQDGVYYMFYTGVTLPEGHSNWYQRIGVATSTDLLEWQRYDEQVFDANHVPWALADSSRFEGCQFRDPCVIEDPEDSGRWLMYYATTPRAAPSQLIVGVGTNQTGLSPWQDLMPLWNTDAAHFLGFIESPSVFEHDGRWYLFFTTNSGHPIRFQHAASPTADSTGWVGNYRLFDSAPDTDAWFAPEYLRVGEHEYFAAVNSFDHTIEIREMQWRGVASFSLTAPSVVGVSDAEWKVEGPGLVALAGGMRGGTARFGVTLPRPMEAEVAVHDVLGRRVRMLHSGALPGGETVVSWDLEDGGGRDVGAGVYLVMLRTAAGTRSVRAPVLR